MKDIVIQVNLITTCNDKTADKVTEISSSSH